MLVQSLESSKYRKVFGTPNNAKLFDKSSHACFLLTFTREEEEEEEEENYSTTQLPNHPKRANLGAER
jgi:hypothetical protein